MNIKSKLLFAAFCVILISAVSAGFCSKDRTMFRHPGTTLEVEIDIKPNSCPNSINTKANGIFSVAILSGDTFDATKVVPESVRLLKLSPVKHATKRVYVPRGSYNEKYLDMVVFFNKRGLTLPAGRYTVIVSGFYRDGCRLRAFFGEDTIRIVR